MPCVDCVSGSKRPTPYKGPRCATHHRARQRAQKDQAHAGYVKRTYGITGAQYWELYEHQGGHCALCLRATGKTKRLAVDHDHSCCAKPPTCGRCTRGLLCSNCNRMLGHARDDQEFFIRAYQYLESPPAREIITGV